MTNKIFNKVEGATALVVFAHGAGADMSHVFMEQVSKLLNEVNISVLRFNFPYMDKRAETGKRYPPDRMPKLLDCYQDVVEQVCEELKVDNDIVDLPIFIGGKSMGSRVAATLVTDDSLLAEETLKKVQGVFCFGYPFHPDKKPEKLRLEPLQQTKKPILILQGDRDTLGSQEEIASYDLSSLCQCQFFEDGDHSLKPRVKSGFTQKQHLTEAVKAIKHFIKVKSSNE